MDTQKWRQVAAALHISPEAPQALTQLSKHYNRIIQPYLDHLSGKGTESVEERVASSSSETSSTPPRRVTRGKRKNYCDSDSSASVEPERPVAPRRATRLQTRLQQAQLGELPSAAEPTPVEALLPTLRPRRDGLRKTTPQRIFPRRGLGRRGSTQAISLSDDEEDEIVVPRKQPVVVIDISSEGSDSEVVLVSPLKQEPPKPLLSAPTICDPFVIKVDAIGKIVSEDIAAPMPKRRKISEDLAVSWRDVRLGSFNIQRESDKLDDVSCAICRLGDRSEQLLVCDGKGCYRGMHADCMDPPLTIIPQGDWFCEKCTTKRHKMAQDDEGDAADDEESLEEFGYASGKVFSLAEFRTMALNFERSWMDPAGEHKIELAAHEDDKDDDDNDNDNDRDDDVDDDDDDDNSDAEEQVSRSCLSKAYADQVEKEYWRLVKNGDEHCSVTYGSDLDVGTYGSGFPVDLSAPASNPELPRWRRHVSNNSWLRHRRNSEYMTKCGWNLNNLPYVSGLQFLNESAGGVTRPMIYVGMLFSSFCWHTEDNFLYSINYVHTGAPKRWYGVPASAANLVESAFRGEVPHLIEKQPNLLYLLVTQIPPDLMRDKYNIPVCTTLQNEGEFIVTFPRAYHAGFNNGFNVAESVNFAAPDWVPWGRLAVEEYRTKRGTVFALEELLTKAALNCKAISDVDFARIVKDELRICTEADFALLNDLQAECDNSDQGALKFDFESTRGVSDYPQCEVCGFDCYLWNCVCECSPETPKCLRHAKVCPCSALKKTIKARFSMAQLTQMLAKVDHRCKELELFTPIRTRSGRAPKEIAL